jgi:hypothetical protein
LSESASGFDRVGLFERFLKVVFSVSGLDRFSLFGRILQLDTESAEKLGFDSFSPVDTESVFRETELFERFLKVFLGFLGLTGFRFLREFSGLTHNLLRLWAVTHFHHLTRNRIFKI